MSSDPRTARCAEFSTRRDDFAALRTMRFDSSVKSEAASDAELRAGLDDRLATLRAGGVLFFGKIRTAPGTEFRPGDIALSTARARLFGRLKSRREIGVSG